MEGGREDEIMLEFRKIEKLLRDQVYDTKLRFENLQNQNKNIITRLSQVEDMISRNILDLMNGGDFINNKRKLKPINNKGSQSHDVLRHGSEEEDAWEGRDAWEHRDRETWEENKENWESSTTSPRGEHQISGNTVPVHKSSVVPPSPSSPSLDYLSTEESKFVKNFVCDRGVRTHSSPNIRHSQSLDNSSALRAPNVFPSAPNFGGVSTDSLQNNLNYFHKNSGLLKPNNCESAEKVYNDLYPKNNAHKQVMASPISVVEIGRSSSSQSQRSRLMEPNKPSETGSNRLNLEQNKADSTVYLNVGGKRFEVLWSTLGQYTSSRLGRLHDCNSHTAMLEICDRYILADSEFFFDRSPRHFESILNLYRTGQLHLMEGVCVQAFAEELAYWGLDDLHLEPCCQYAFYRMKQFLPNPKEDEKEEVDEFGSSRFNRARKWVWELFEEPNKTKLGKVENNSSYCHS